MDAVRRKTAEQMSLAWSLVPHVTQHDQADILFGIVSFLDQFSAVLRERGKEYRNANTGSALVAQVEKLTACFDQTDWASLISEPPQNVPTEHIAFASEKRQPATAFPRQRSSRPRRRPGSEEPLSAVYL